MTAESIWHLCHDCDEEWPEEDFSKMGGLRRRRADGSLAKWAICNACYSERYNRHTVVCAEEGCSATKQQKKPPRRKWYCDASRQRLRTEGVPCPTEGCPWRVYMRSKGGMDRMCRRCLNKAYHSRIENRRVQIDGKVYLVKKLTRPLLERMIEREKEPIAQRFAGRSVLPEVLEWHRAHGVLQEEALPSKRVA